MVVLVVVSGARTRCFGWSGRALVATILVQVLARDSTQGEVQIPKPVSVGRAIGELVFLV